MPTIDPTAFETPSLATLIRHANEDSDAASCFVFGTDWEHAQGAIIIIKGRGAAELAVDVLEEHHLLNQFKPVRG